ncbi:MAG: ribosome biogenesis GTPase Der [Rhabdochlamydiaceae bacterium]|nr:ribosome biogenesis GTPase Der [Candidatus Amphrikana amoebophyrae]
MKKPTIKVAIVGRPNVGKSALFNRMCEQRIAIVDEMEGVTRDRLYADTDYFGTHFELIDTAGIDPKGDGAFNREVIAQSQMAIEEADAILMVVDAQLGALPLDLIVNQIVRKSGKPHILAINKVEGQTESMKHDFYPLGIAKMIEVSAIHGRGMEELFEAILEEVDVTEKEPVEEGVKLAIIGRPNVGKSTMLNSILKEQRAVVSDIAGTTRDSIDVQHKVNDQVFTLIDTAGIRRKHKEEIVVDKFAAIRTTRAIERSDICIMVIDVNEGLTTQEKHILSDIESAKKGCILFLNKWDKTSGVRMEHVRRDIVNQSPFLKECPMIFGSALCNRNLDKIFEVGMQVYEQLHRRISTSDLNEYLERAMQLNHPPMVMGKRLRVYYMTQIEVSPPQFILFVNYKDRITPTYQKYLMNEFRKRYGFKGSPIRFYIKKKAQKELPHLSARS